MNGVIEVGSIYRDLKRRRGVLQAMQERLERLEEREGIKWLAKAKTKDDWCMVMMKYGKALDRYYKRYSNS